jgi:4-hydroxybenzoyl-CoA thioesterase
VTPVPKKSASLNGNPKAYRAEILVRFADCDPAGIVFYPRYLEMFNNLVEDWCREELKFSFPEIITERGWGLPTVHLEVDFVAPSRLGDILSATVSVRSVGTSSIGLDILLSGPDGNDRVRGEVVLVLTERQPGRALRLPDDVRVRIAALKVSD